MAALDDGTKACRELYWEEMTTEQRVVNLCHAVELLWRRVADLEDENRALRQHNHVGEKLVVPLVDKNRVNDYVPYRYDVIRHAPRPLSGPENG